MKSNLLIVVLLSLLVGTAWDGAADISGTWVFSVDAGKFRRAMTFVFKQHVGAVGANVLVMRLEPIGSGEKTPQLAARYNVEGIDELVILEGSFTLQRGDPAEIIRRMRKLWIMKKATQPLSFQSAGCIFKNPRGLSAGALIEQAGLKGIRMGGAEISDRHANFVVTKAGAKSEDVLRLIDLARSKVSEQFGVDLELEIKIW